MHSETQKELKKAEKIIGTLSFLLTLFPTVSDVAAVNGERVDLAGDRSDVYVCVCVCVCF